ncbi:MAG: 16S rRNA (adenine(1518)-N(6)/adenine(1519)-N(6))-dimethyltransferase RsmA [Bacteriovoracaceae bacterium]
MKVLPQANKTLGQHFLRDQNVINKITSNFVKECDVIVEVGPGPAILTQKLKAHDLPLWVIEKDDRFIPTLSDLVSEEKVFHVDALTFLWSDFLKAQKLVEKKIWLVSNLPYNISVPLLIGFTQIAQIQYLSLMFQKEVGHKIINVEKEKNFSNSLGLLMENYFLLKVVCKVPPGAFVPPPKVDSIVISFERRHDPTVPLVEFLTLETFLRDLFRFKRKQIGGVLKHLPNLTSALEKLKIAREARAESLSSDLIFALYKEVKGNY